MTTTKYHVFATAGPATLWSVVKSVPYIVGSTGAGFSNTQIGHATSLSGAVQVAQEHAGRPLEWTWADSFVEGEGQ